MSGIQGAFQSFRSFAPPPEPPPPNTAAWFGGGDVGINELRSRVDRITFATDTATASVRGPLSVINRAAAAVGNSNYAWFGAGLAPGTPSGGKSTVERITYATDTATASVRGPLSLARYKFLAAVGNSDYGWFGGGFLFPGINYSRIDRITYATDTATASVRGPLSLARYALAAAGNTTDGWFGGGATPSNLSRVDRITYATDTDTAVARGPLSAGKQYLAAAGNSTDGWFGGSYPPNSTVDRITYATDTNTASVRGPLSGPRNQMAAAGGIQ